MATSNRRYPEVIAAVNLKGGVGKTTLSVNLAYGLAFFQGARVLMVDMDPQANATQYLLIDQVYWEEYLSERATKATVVDLYDDYLINHRRPGWTEEGTAPKNLDRYRRRIYDEGKGGYLDLVASKLDLALVAMEGGTLHGQVRWLIQHLGADYDYVFIDCPPTMSRMLWAALESAQSVFVPIRPEYLSVVGMPLLLRTLQEIYPREVVRRPEWLGALQILGLAFTMVDARTLMAQESIESVSALAAKHGLRIFTQRISDSTKFTWGAKQKLPIFRSEPASRYAGEVKALVAEFVAALPMRRGS